MGEEYLRSVEAVTHEPAMQPDAIPRIDLYMDQVTTLLERELGATKRSEEDKIMTKTMINNYSKEKLLPASQKKKYSRHHILLLALIYEYKQILSINDIHTLLAPLIDDPEGLEAFYQTYLERDAAQKELLQRVLAQETSDDLRLIASTLVTRASLEKRLAERLLDHIVETEKHGPESSEPQNKMKGS